MTKERDPIGSRNGSRIELDIWLARFEAQGRVADDQYILDNITSKKGGSLGAKVARTVMAEWFDDDLSFETLLSMSYASLLHAYGAQPLHAFLRAEQFVMNGRDNPPAPSLVKDEVEEIVDEMLAPETEEEALQEETEEYLEGRRDEALLLASKDPRVFIDRYADRKIAFFLSLEQSAVDEDEVFTVRSTQRAFKYTKERFRLLYDRAQELETTGQNIV